ncbi:MAG: murein biosynthesis integral membrane protein MurJ [Desulfovibrio sp.]|nr:murein biosynthesis integral membrane protein MurJ [Desulfovibrio sp.]
MSLFGSSQRLGVAALLLAFSNLLSRLMGLIRDKVISWQFGAGHEADMYFAAFVVPDCINYLLAGGFMSITIIPLLSRSFQENPQEAWRFFSCVVSWFAIASLVCTGLGMLFAVELTEFVAPGFTYEQKLRLAFFMRLILPAQVFFLTGACFTALLFLRRQFRVPALTPLIYNGCIILGGLLLPALLLLFEPEASFQEMSQKVGMTGYCLGVSIGALLGAFVLPLLAARQQALPLTCCFSHPLLKKFLLVALPLMLGQTIIMLDEQFLRIFGSMLGEGVVSLLNYARRIAQVPIGLVGQAAAVASYPFLVALLTQGKEQEFAQTLNKALRMGLCLIIPCAAGLLACSWAIITLIFQGGRFGAAESTACVPLLQIMLLAVPLSMLYMVLVRAFYAHGDTITPAVSGTLMTALAIPVYYFISARHSAMAIALTSSLSIGLYILWLFAIWAKRYGSQALHGLGRLSAILLCLAAPATLLSWLSLPFLREMLALSPLLQALVVLILQGGLFLLLFVPPALWLVPELRQSLLRFRNKS